MQYQLTPEQQEAIKARIAARKASGLTPEEYNRQEANEQDKAQFNEQDATREERLAHARSYDSACCDRAIIAARKAIGLEFQARFGADRITGKIVACTFEGLTVGPRGGVKACWKVTIRNEQGTERTGYFDVIPRRRRGF